MGVKTDNTLGGGNDTNGGKGGSGDKGGNGKAETVAAGGSAAEKKLKAGVGKLTRKTLNSETKSVNRRGEKEEDAGGRMMLRNTSGTWRSTSKSSKRGTRTGWMSRGMCHNVRPSRRSWLKHGENAWLTVN